MKDFTATHTKFMHRDNLYDLVKDKMTQEQLVALLEKLCDDGDLCHAFDNEHYILPA